MSKITIAVEVPPLWDQLTLGQQDRLKEIIAEITEVIQPD